MRIAIANDMGLAVEVLKRVLISSREHEIAWVARDGLEAVEKCRQDRPDLILMDLVMPRLSGVEATRQIMLESPCAILVVTASVNSLARDVFEALGAGALDAIKTPHLGLQMDGTALLAKIRVISRLLSPKKVQTEKVEPTAKQREEQAPPLLVLGSSSGGPKALVQLLSSFPADFPASVAVVQHIDTEFVPGLVSWLQKHCALPVSMAINHQKPRPGEVLVAATEGHLKMSASGRYIYSMEPSNLVHRPSVDVFFQSVAKNWPASVIGVILTGMGSDGSDGLLALRQAGHHTIAQDRESSAIYGMPKAAADKKAACEILSIDHIGSAIISKLRKEESRRVNC